jgi:glycosyltransferase involved in cell wall biosynthesis
MMVTPPRPAANAPRRPHLPRGLHVAIGRSAAEPWWCRHLDHRTMTFDMDYALVVDPKGRPRHPLSLRFWRMAVRTIGLLFRARREGYEYIFTVECDWTTFIIAGLQTLLWLRRPRHVVLQFIMREKTASVASRAKYAFMRWCFSSVSLFVCSARPECDYYARAFGWPSSRFAFVPLHTDPAFLDAAVEDAGAAGYAVAAGRTFRDYETLLDAFAELEYPLTIVGYRRPENRRVPERVTIHHQLALADLTRLIARSSIVILPLQEQQISIGQSVLLQAMAMGKAVIVTGVNGTVDYVEHMKTGVLVPPGDSRAIREAVEQLAADPALRYRLGSAARAQIVRAHLLTHYLQQVSQTLERQHSKASPSILGSVAS